MGDKGKVLGAYKDYLIYWNSNGIQRAIYPHELALLLHTGLLEEVKEGKIELWKEMPSEGVEYWSIVTHLGHADIAIMEEENGNCDADKYNFKSKNMHKTRESAEEALRLIMES